MLYYIIYYYIRYYVFYYILNYVILHNIILYYIYPIPVIDCRGFGQNSYTGCVKTDTNRFDCCNLLCTQIQFCPMKFGVASLQKQLGFMADHVWNSTDSVEFPGVSLRLDSTAIRWPSATDSESKCSILLRKDCSFKKTSIPLKLCENRSFKFPSSQRMLFQPSKFRKEHMNPTENWKGWRKKKRKTFPGHGRPQSPLFFEACGLHASISKQFSWSEFSWFVHDSLCGGPSVSDYSDGPPHGGTWRKSRDTCLLPPENGIRT